MNNDLDLFGDKDGKLKINASYFKKRSNKANMEKMPEILQKIGEASDEGKYELDTKVDLTEESIEYLENIDFDVYEYEEGEDEYDDGYRYNICWKDADDED